MVKEDKKVYRQVQYRHETQSNIGWLKRKPIITMLCGLPGSGKSTYAKFLEEDGAHVFSSDEIRKEMYGSYDDQKHNNEVFMELHSRIKDCLTNGDDAVFDATNIESKKRRSFLQYISNVDCVKNCAIIATPVEICHNNNMMRKRVVPGKVIDNMRERWQTPHWFEGFDDVYIRYGKGTTSNHLLNPVDIALSLKDYEQHNAHHSLTLGNHMLKTFELCDTNEMDVLYACLMHDYGKIFTKSFINYNGSESNTAHYYNHEHVSAYESLFISSSYINQVNVSALITWHMQPYYWERENNERLHDKYKRIWGEKFYKQLMYLHEADKKAH